MKVFIMECYETFQQIGEIIFTSIFAFIFMIINFLSSNAFIHQINVRYMVN